MKLIEQYKKPRIFGYIIVSFIGSEMFCTAVMSRMLDNTIGAIEEFKN